MLRFSLSTPTALRRQNYGFIFTIVGFLFWVYTISTTRIWWIDPQLSFGLFQMMPIWFWVALFFQIAGIIFALDSKKFSLFMFQLLILNLLVLGTSVLVEPNARVNDTWGHMGTAKTILDSGKIQIKDAPTYWYLQNPLAFVFTSMLLNVSAIPQMGFMQLFPLLASTFFLVGFYVWARSMLPNDLSQKFCTFLLLLLNLWLRFHLNPQAFGLILLPILLASFAKEGRLWSAVTIILSIVMIMFHPITPSFVILLLGAESTILWFLGRKSNYRRFLLVLFTWIAWHLFYAVIFFQRWIVLRTIKNLLNISMFQITVSTQLGYRSIPSIIRIAVFGITAIFAVWQIWHIRKKSQPSFATYVAWLAASAIIAVLDLLVYQAEFGDRFFAFAALLTPILVAQFIWSGKKRIRIALVLFVVLIGVANLSTLYYYENYWIVSDSTLEAGKFVTTYGYSQTIYGHRLNIYEYYYQDLNEKDVYRYWGPSDYVPPGSILIYDDYSNASKFEPYLTAMTNMYFGKVGDVIIYDNGPFKVHVLLLP